MRKSVLFGGIFALIILLLMVIWLRSPKEKITGVSVSEKSSSVVFSNGIATQINDELHSISNDVAISSSNAAERAESIRQYMESQNVSVEFYGKVIDQDGNSLSGARVKAHVRHWIVNAPVAFGSGGSSIPLERESDYDGQFKLDGATGDVLGIDSVTKSGYEIESEALQNFSARSGSMITPVVFKMWNTNIHEQLLTGAKSLPIIPDGRQYSIDFTKGTLDETGSGDLRFWVKFPTNTVRDQIYDWACEIFASKGGLLEETNSGASMFSAPVDGYTNSFRLRYSLKGGQRGSSGERHFYVKFKNGQEYGRITIELFAPYNITPGLVRVQYAINPNGSRILR